MFLQIPLIKLLRLLTQFREIMLLKMSTGFKTMSREKTYLVLALHANCILCDATERGRVGSVAKFIRTPVLQ